VTFKYCPHCYSNFNISFFAKNITTPDGLQCWCKQCMTDDSRTLSGVVRKIYSKQRESSRKRGHSMPSYSLNELRAWCLSKPDFIKLHSLWVESNFERELAPSVDRVNDDIGYSFYNIQVMSWRDNMVKGHNSPHVNRDELCLSVEQLSKDGAVINEFRSIYAAGKATGIYKENIASCCLGKLKTAGKFKWRHKK